MKPIFPGCNNKMLSSPTIQVVCGIQPAKRWDGLRLASGTARVLVASVVVFKAQMCNQLFAAKVAQCVLELHQLDENVMLRIEARRSLRRFKIEGQPLLDSFHPCPLCQIHQKCQIKNDWRGEN